MKKINKLLEFADKKTGVWAAVISCLTLFSLIELFLPGWYEGLPRMKELVCGQVIWSGYAKQADLTLVRCIILGLPVLFVLFYLLDCLLRKRGLWHRRETAAAVGGYLLCLFLFLVRAPHAWQYAEIYAVLLGGFLLTLRSVPSSASQAFVRHVESAFLCYLLALSALLLVSFRFWTMAQLWQSYSLFMSLFFVLPFLGFCLSPKFADRARKGIFLLQPLLPMGLMGMCRFRYVTEAGGSKMELFGSTLWKAFCLGLALVLLVSAVWQIVGKREKRGLTGAAFVTAACLRVFTQPDGLLSIDFFHNGELLMPMQQWIDHGRLPYDGLIPIHGMCDYFYGFVAEVFFDGTYLSLNAAKIAGGLLMASLLAAVIYLFVSDTLTGLFLVYFSMPFLIGVAGLRYLFLFILFLVLFSDRVQDGFWYLWTWILLSILATAWNGSIGGAAAFGFLPVAIYKACFVLPGQLGALFAAKKRRELTGKLFAGVCLLALGLSYIPLFRHIVEYLRDNTGTTDYVNGMEMFASGMSPGEALLAPGFFFTAFGFVIPLLFCLYECMQRKSRAWERLVALLACFLVLINYAFVRFDEGLRSGVMGGFFSLLILLIVLSRLTEDGVGAQSGGQADGLRKAKSSAGKEQSGAGKAADGGLLWAAFAICGFLLWISDTPLWITSSSMALTREVPDSVEISIMGRKKEDPVVYVTGESVGLPKLGSGFVQGNTLNSLCNVRDVLETYHSAGKTCLNLTNQVADQVVFGLNNFWQYTSVYNIANDRMQRKAIADLERKSPDLILVAPEIVFDDAPFGLRSPLLYQYLMRQGYQAWKYENVIYLVREDNLVPGAVRDEESLAQLWHKKALGELPAVWGQADRDQLADVTGQIGSYTVVEEETGFSVVFSQPIAGREATLLSLEWSAADCLQGEGRTEDEEDDSADMELSFCTDLKEDGGEVSYVFAIDRSDRFLVPVGLSPYFSEAEQIRRLSFSYDKDRWKIETGQVRVGFYRFR